MQLFVKYHDILQCSSRQKASFLANPFKSQSFKLLVNRMHRHMISVQYLCFIRVGRIG